MVHPPRETMATSVLNRNRRLRGCGKRCVLFIEGLSFDVRRAGTLMASTRDGRVATWSRIFYAKDARKEILQKEGVSQVFPACPMAIL